MAAKRGLTTSGPSFDHAQATRPATPAGNRRMRGLCRAMGGIGAVTEP